MRARYRHRIFNKYIVSLAALSAILLFVIYYYFYPRYTLGYSNVKISKYTWESAYPGFPNFAATLYYKRFDNEYNYKAYLIYEYDSYIRFMMNENAEISPLHKEVVDRISSGFITDEDKMIIDGMLHQFRELFLRELRNFHSSNEYVCMSFVGVYFTYFYHHEHEGFPLDRREFAAVVSWLKQNDKNLQKHIEDPYNWRNCDFSILKNIPVLRNWISLHHGSDFLRDVDTYEKWVDKFREHLKQM